MRLHPLIELLLLVFPLCGCATLTSPYAAQSRMMQPANPVFVPASDLETVWEDTVDVLHAFQFPIERENKLDGIIETGYKPGAGLLEPWHRDSVTMNDRLESSFQSIRRRATISLQPVQGGYYVGVEVQKELEDPQKLIINSPGYATFRETAPLQRDLDVVVGPSSPDGWILIGREPNLEQSILARLNQAYLRP